ncbi:LssY C-terminal domain-containing protein [Arthrobacter sp. SX1312]|uniref:LssY C-terminal domain-containing protein n=1 Tax=Arthrobacter sp. SX1312 TaxID=2058896 RepID=UPI000CE32724|nr:LssY C-terminal domain-containing protein [Arthrobacter sp. SX1312]
MTAQPGVVLPAQDGAGARDTVIDRALFAFSGLAAVWFAVILLEETLQWGQLWFGFVFWVVLAYLVLPRVHRILTRIYLPDYFIGRARTSDGLLGDPVNVALLGTAQQLHTAMRRAGWILADAVDLRSSRRIVTATLRRRSYDQAPVSPLFLFGRQQDLAYQQEVDNSPGKRHHIRFWPCPPGWVLPGGTAVDWLAAGTYDRSVGLSLFTLQITHKIEADTDRERDFVLASLQASDPGIGVRVIEDFSTGYHSRNGGGDTISTDGNLPVVDLTGVEPDPEAPLPPVDQRRTTPAPTVVGAILVGLRGLAALALGLALLGGSADALVAAGSNARVLPAVAVVLHAFGFFELILARFVLRGGNRARITAMILSAVAITSQAVVAFGTGAPVTFETTLLGLSLDILLIIALSSQRSREFAHRHRPG